MQRQFRVTDPSGHDTLLNMFFEGDTVWPALKREASRAAGGSSRGWRVVLVPRGYELDLPFDELPVMMPRYPLPKEVEHTCVECERLFLTWIRVEDHQAYCSRACRERLLRRNGRRRRG